jgi:hypothetical protein
MDRASQQFTDTLRCGLRGSARAALWVVPQKSQRESVNESKSDIHHPVAESKSDIHHPVAANRALKDASTPTIRFVRSSNASQSESKSDIHHPVAANRALKDASTPTIRFVRSSNASQQEWQGQA